MTRRAALIHPRRQVTLLGNRAYCFCAEEQAPCPRLCPLANCQLNAIGHLQIVHIEAVVRG